VLGEDTTIIKAASGLIGSMDEARDAMIRRVDEALPPSPDTPGCTAEVDVVGVSMGGLVAAYAAMPRDDGGRRLKIARLFTICSPLRGARAADVPTLEDRVVDMRPGSVFLTKVNNAHRDYQLYAYCRLGDRIVGEENASPTGVTPWWVATPPMRMAHLGSVSDWRIVADVSRRLRGEPAYAVEPAAALPTSDR
jgi:pimeloyl-ACP methyl ester carboxylesterase